MSAIKKIHPSELIIHAASYIYNPAEFLGFEESLTDRIQRFAGSYGNEIDSHLVRTSGMLGNVLTYGLIGDRNIRTNIRVGNRHHDVGKTALPSQIFNVVGEVSDDIKAQRIPHIDAIEEVLEEHLELFPHLKGHPHLSTILCIGGYHHDRINESGPRGEGDLDKAAQLIGIVDTYDGKMIARPGKAQKSHEEILAQMTGVPNASGIVKHPKGEFNSDLLAMFAAHFSQYSYPHLSRGLANRPADLALDRIS